VREPRPIVAVVVFPGSNDDQDAAWALGALGAEAKLVWHAEEELPAGTAAVVLPGGFSYGDYLRCGAIARFSPVMRAVAGFATEGGPVLGICNGFQILCEAGLLPGVLRPNASLSFVCRDVALRVERAAAPFTSRCKQGQRLVIPVKHGEGCWFAPPELVKELERTTRRLRYGAATRAARRHLRGRQRAGQRDGPDATGARSRSATRLRRRRGHPRLAARRAIGPLFQCWGGSRLGASLGSSAEAQRCRQLGVPGELRAEAFQVPCAEGDRAAPRHALGRVGEANEALAARLEQLDDRREPLLACALLDPDLVDDARRSPRGGTRVCHATNLAGTV
jgi:phosphoribosylformylglycinamidine synthase